jgi:hypothetical protein
MHLNQGDNRAGSCVGKGEPALKRDRGKGRRFDQPEECRLGPARETRVEGSYANPETQRLGAKYPLRARITRFLSVRC